MKCILPVARIPKTIITEERINMKIKTLMANINKDIDEITKRKDSLLHEIVQTKDQLAEIDSKIHSYDSDDIAGFNELRATQAFYEHNLEMLNAKLSENKSIDEAKAKDDMNTFRTERAGIIRKASKDVLPLIDKLSEIQCEASAELSELKATFDLYCRTYNLPSEYQLQGMVFGRDDKNMLGNIRMFVDRIKELTKE